MKTIALLGTGDEIINGDIINTNAQAIAQQLIQHNMQPGNHMVAADDDSDLQSAMEYLLQRHDALITIGGLGPTSDDLTRFALAKTVNQALKFSDSSWQMITERLTKFNLEIPESNRQQCLFPQGASILPNRFGTANGCKLESQGKIIYMLPGPPNECLPMFKGEVLPDLINRQFTNDQHRKSWMLLGVSEGSIAETLDDLVKESGVTIGYRVDYPYLEVKCLSDDQASLDNISEQIEKLFLDKIVSHHRKMASEILTEWINKHDVCFQIHDLITGGMLEQRLRHPETDTKIAFNPESNEQPGIHVALHGLSSYWQQDDSIKTDHIDMSINHDGDIVQQKIAIPYRGKRMQAMAVESICWHLLQQLIRMLDHESVHTG